MDMAKVSLTITEKTKGMHVAEENLINCLKSVMRHMKFDKSLSGLIIKNHLKFKN
ncbi:MAG: hypothetical protein HQK53_16370 [Oligoflexia bacterium]|nr:hypothetical protein [Oligoflexia bacterium]